MNVLYVGDIHCQISNLEESERLMTFVHESSLKYNVDRIILLGDLNHTHDVTRVRVTNFWHKWLKVLSACRETFVLVGNHDQISHSSSEHSLKVFFDSNNKNLRIIEGPTMFGMFGYMPYLHDNQKFIEQATELSKYGCKVLICHADFDGARYENGFYCPNGIKQEELNFDLIISGHIHKRSRFGKIIYPGTARWLTSSDKNEPKGLWLVEHDNITGAIINEQFLDTSHVCTPIYAYTYEEGGNCPEIPEGSRASVELIGTSEWISKQKAKFKGKASISVKITDKEKPKNRKTGNSLEHFVTNVFEITSTVKKDKMVNLMKELGIL